MGAVLTPNSEEKKENIYFAFQENTYNTYEKFAESVEINGTNDIGRNEWSCDTCKEIKFGIMRSKLIKLLRQTGMKNLKDGDVNVDTVKTI